jgi:hypothetical protein
MRHNTKPICHSERSEESKKLRTLSVQGKEAPRFFPSFRMTDFLMLPLQACAVIGSIFLNGREGLPLLGVAVG